VQAHRFIFDDRDQLLQERLDVLADPDGVWRCRTVYNCTPACPRGIEVTRAIGEVKKAIQSGKRDF
jgi:succinate dehydrogenase / fumarate reductase iron-sulfur subunit